MTSITFTVPGIPVAQPRARASVVCGRAKIVSAVRKDPVNDFKAAVKLCAHVAYKGPLLDGPLSVTLTYRFDRNKKDIRKRGDNPPLYKTTTPDVDNLMKSVFDALNGVLWKDDALIAESHVVKTFAALSEKPGVDVSVSLLDDAVLAESWRTAQQPPSASS